MSRWIRFSLLSLGIVVAFLAVAAAGALVWLNTTAGRDFVLKTAANAAAESGLEVTFQGVEGRLLEQISVRSATLSDPQGRWLQLDRLILRWKPSALLRGRLQIDAVEAGRIEVMRPPALPPAPEGETGGGVPSIPLTVALDRLAVERLVIGEAVAGHAAELALNASAKASGNAARLALDLRRLDRPGAVHARIGYDIGRNALDLELKAEEPKGGMVAGLAGLPGQPALRAMLAGAGPLSDWSGQLRVTADEADWIKLDGSVAGQATRKIAVSGTVGLLPLASEALLPPDLLPVIGASLALTAKATVTDKEISLDAAEIAADAAGIAFSGHFIPDTQRWSATLDLRRLAPELAARYGVALEQPAVHAEAQGAGEKIEAALRLGAGRIAASGAAAEAVAATIDMVRPGRDDPITVEAKLDSKLTALPGGKAAAPLLGPASIRAQAAIKGAAVALRDLSLRAEPVTLHASGDYAGETAQAKLSAELRDIGAFAGSTDPALQGAAQLDAILRYGRNDGLAVEDFALVLPQGRITGRAALDAAFEQVDASIAIPGLTLDSLSSLLGMPVAGELAGTITASGPVADPAGAVSLRLSGAAVSGTQLPPLALDVDAAQLASAPRGAVLLAAHPPQGKIQLRHLFAMTGDRLDLKDIALDGPGLAADGEISVALDGGLATGEIRIDARDLGPVLQIAGMAGGGSVNAEVALATRNGAQTAQVSGAATALALARGGEKLLNLQQASIDASGGLGARSPISARLEVEKLAGGGAEIAAITLDAGGTFDQLRIDLGVSAPAYRSFEIALQGTLRNTKDTRILQLTGGNGSVMGKPFTVSPGMEAEVAPDTYRLRDLVVSGPELGRLALSGEMAQGRIDADANLRDVPLAILNTSPEEGWGGQLSLSARASGTVERPMGNITLEASDVRLPGGTAAPPGDTAPAGDIVLKATLDREAGAAELRVTGLSEQPLTGRARVGRGPAGLGFDDGSPVSGAISWNGRIENLTRLAPLVGQRVAGNMALDAEVGGTIGRPTANGQLLVTDTLVEAYASGTIMRLPRVELMASEREVVLRPFEAQVAGGGGLSGQGRLSLDGAAGFPLSAELDLRNARLVDRDEITAALSGRVSAGGSLEAPEILARLKSERIEIRADAVAPPSVTTVEVREVGPAPEHGLPKPEEADGDVPASGPEIGLDVVLQMPQEVFVRGRGLDSEWRGNIEVTGTAAKPRVTGQLSSVRGRIDLVGKTFELRPSKIDLAPNATGGVDALLSIVAVHQGEEISVTINVTGPATQPKLTLTSTPALPQEEILSQLLFNKSRAELTAFEAVQLAQAVSTLSGGGPGPLATIRNAVGVDVLRLDAGEGDSGPAVETGKYVTEDVYVGVKQGTGPSSGAVTVEIDVFPNVVVESELRQDGSNRLGAKYRFDY